MKFTGEPINKTLDTATPIYLHMHMAAFATQGLSWTSAHIPLMAHKLNLL